MYAADLDAILATRVAREQPALATLSRLILRGQSVRGCLTILFEGHVLQYGRPSKEQAAVLGAVHRDEGAVEARAGDEVPLDLAAPDLGLEIDRARRFPLPRHMDRKPGEWVDPVVKVHSGEAFVRMLAQRNLGLGEAFLEGQIEMLRGSIHHLVAFLIVNDVDRGVKLPAKEAARLVLQYARWRLERSHNEDIAHHYDVGDNIMVPMLGATGCYSCGYMERETDDLDTMQLNKINLVFSKMRLAPGMHILDTGCGNGGMLVHAALQWGATGEGFTNSHNMASLAQRNADRNGAGHKVKVHHADFSILERYPDETFDAIYEVGVWEHLPFSQYRAVMEQCWRILKPHGRMLIHSMASHTAVHQRDAYIQKYIFRDSNQIRLHHLLTEAARHDMYCADVENIGRHYYWTLWYWRQNLLAAYEADPSIDTRDFKVQLYFLECCMAESRFGDGLLYQILLFKDPRDYRKTWRVDARVHEPGHGAITQAAFTMLPSTSNLHLHKDAFAPAKARAKVYERPSLFRRIAHLADIVRAVSHQ